MQMFFIVKNNVSRSNDDNLIVSTLEEKTEILHKLNIDGFVFDDYTFYDESKLNEKSKFIDAYQQSVFEVYFPSVKQKDGSIVYYPKPQIIETPDSTVYINRWEKIDVHDIDISSMIYFCDDSDKEEHQRTLILFKNNKPMETIKCE